MRFADDDRRGKPSGTPLTRRPQIRGRDVAGAGGVDGDSRPAAAAAVDVNGVAHQHRRRGIAHTLLGLILPQDLARGRIEPLRPVGRGHQQLLFASHAGQHGSAVGPFDLAFLLPDDVAGLDVEGQQLRGLRGQVAGDDHRVVMDDGAGAESDVEVERGDFFAPDDLAAMIDGGQDGGAEQDVHVIGVAGRRRTGVAAAQVGQLPRAGRDDDVPLFRTGLRVEAADVVLGKLFPGNAFRPIGNGDEDALAPDDGAGLVLVAADLVGRKQGHFPEDVFEVLAAPCQRQIFFVALAHAGRALSASRASSPPPAEPDQASGPGKGNSTPTTREAWPNASSETPATSTGSRVRENAGFAARILTNAAYGNLNRVSLVAAFSRMRLP